MEKKLSPWQKARWSIWNLLWFLTDTAESALQWVAKWTTWAASTIWEWWAFVTDLVLWTDLWNKEWFLDKIDKAANEKLKQDWEFDVIKSDWWKTDAGKVVLWAADTIWQIAVPYTWWMKVLKLTKGWLGILKKSSAARKELNTLIQNAKKNKTEITQDDINAIFNKYWQGIKDNAIQRVQTWHLGLDRTTASNIRDKISKADPKAVEEAIEKLPMSLKKKLWYWVWGTTWMLWILWYEAAELDEKKLDTLSDEELNQINNTLDNNNNNNNTQQYYNTINKDKDLRWRKLTIDPWANKIWYKSEQTWEMKRFDTEEQAKEDITKWVLLDKKSKVNWITSDKTKNKDTIASEIDTLKQSLKQRWFTDEEIKQYF